MSNKTIITRRTLVKGLSYAAAGASLAGCSRLQAMRLGKLAIIYTNDTHGYDLFNDESLGMAAVAQLRADYEEQGYDVLVLDCGDAMQGNSVVSHTRGDAAVEFMNAAGYDCMGLGNHELDFGQEKALGFVQSATFPIISASVVVNETGKTLFDPHVVLTTKSGTKVGIFALTTPETAVKTNPLLVEGLTFLSGDELAACAQKEVEALKREGCDLFVCLAHLGESDVSAPNRAMDVVAATTGIDLVIDGHDHQEESQVLENADGEEVLVVEADCHTHAIGVVTWEQGVLTDMLVRHGEYDKQDEHVDDVIREKTDWVTQELALPVASCEFALDAERANVRSKETNQGDLVADALLWEMRKVSDEQIDAAIINGGAIRLTLEPGEITLDHVINTLPFINYGCTVKVTGAQLLEALEAACWQTPEEEGAFPQIAELSFTLDTRVPYESAGLYPDSVYQKPAKPGSRVTIHGVGGRAFSPDETYVIASTDFVCAGGDTYHAFAEAAEHTLKGTNYLTSECLRYYLVEECAGVVPEHYEDPQARVTILS